MLADLIIIGNELLNGKIQDLNTQTLAKSLLKKGIKLRKAHIVMDGTEDFGEIIDNIQKKSQYLFISGGLGPTLDDVTKNMLAEYFDFEIVENHKAYEIAKFHYHRGGREYDKELIHYHQLPHEFTPIHNPVGYAPGIHYATESFKVFALPGVPSELEGMLEHVIIPEYIDDGEFIIENITYKTWGVPEAKIFGELCPGLWQKLEAFGMVASLPHITGVDIGVSVTTNSHDELTKIKKKIHKIIMDSNIADNIWHIGNESIEEVIITEAKAKNLKIGFAESCTGGLCGSRITDVSGSSSVFWGSIVSYSNDVKMKTLEVTAETLKNHGAVSEQTAKEMASGVLKEMQVDIAVTTTGIAGPGGGSAEKPVGTVGIGVAYKDICKAKIFNPKGNRKVLKRKFSDLAMMNLLRAIRDY